jgi:flavin reductase (DIM6/NTAB) family NADH-FMN oxidoreductase RutF
VIDEFEFRRILGHLPTGVTVVTTLLPDGAPCGLTASAVCSLSLNPPLVLVCIDRDADSYEPIRAAGTFSVNVLPAEQEGLARRFAGEQQSQEKFDGVAYRTESTGAPILDIALAWVDCRVCAEYAGGDHTIFVGEVLAGGAREGTPLLYYRGGYGWPAP